MSKLKVIFMASDKFAISQLSHLLQMHSVEIISVYTKSPKQQKRGKKILPNDVDIFAIANNLIVRHFDSLKGHIFDNNIEKDVDLIIVSAYGVLLPKYVLEYPKYGCINVHPSLLPRWRGASPIQSAILNGDESTAVSIIKLTDELDAGDIIISRQINLNMQENCKTLKAQLSSIASDLLEIILSSSEQLEEYLNNSVKQVGEIVYCAKIYKTEIDWSENIILIDRMVRAFSGVNCKIFSNISDSEMSVKLHEIRYMKLEHKRELGFIEIENDNIVINGVDGLIIPEIIQPASGKKITIKEFIDGYGKIYFK